MKDLNEYVNQLCEDLTQLKNTRWSHCAEDGAYYGVKEGRKYIKIVSYDNGVSSTKQIQISKREMFFSLLGGIHLLLIKQEVI